jgi:tetratricopeptide (TPR) repeat protein
MKTRNVVILVVVTSVISIAFTFLVVSAVRTNEQRMHREEVLLKKETAPAPVAQAVPQPDVNKTAILALFDVGKEDRRKKAIESVKKAMRDVPPYIGTGTKGYPFALKGQYEKAVQISEEEIRDNPDVVGPRYTLAWIYARTGNYNGATAVCNEALQRGPDFNNMRYIMGWVYAKQGKYEDALKTCEDALRIDPYSAMLYYAKGRIEDMFGHNDAAIAAYTRATSLKTDFTEAYVALGLLYFELGRYDDAIKTYRQVLGFNKYSPGAYLGLGLVYDQKGNYGAALTELKNAVTLGSFGAGSDNPKQPLTVSVGIDDAVIYNNIGILNDRLGNYSDALAAFNSAIAARPDYPDAYRGLVLTNLLLGDRESALESYDKLKSLDTEMANSLSAVVKEAK